VIKIGDMAMEITADSTKDISTNQAGCRLLTRSLLQLDEKILYFSFIEPA